MKKIILITALLVSQATFAQFPESFETSVPPTEWVSFIGTNGIGTSQDWKITTVANSGSQAAYIRYENVSGGTAEDWLVTPQFTPDASTNLLTFMQRQSYTTDYGSSYTVRVSTTSQNTPADFVVVDTQTETDFTYYYTIKEIDISTYEGIPIYIAFVMENDDGDDWYIDDVALSTIPTCDAPTLLALYGLTTTSAVVSWTPSGSQNSYNLRLYLGTDTSTPPIIEHLNLSSSLLNSESYLVGLASNTSYYCTIQSVCSSDTSTASGIGFITLPTPIIPNPDYIEDFTTFPGTLWNEAIGTLAGGPIGATSDWESDIYTNQGSDNAAKLNIYFNNTNHWLISPDINLSTDTYLLTLDAAVTEWNATTASNMGSDDSVKLLISEDAGSTWTVLYTWDVSNTPSNTGSTIPAIDLSSYTSVVRFAFLGSDGTVNDSEDYDFFIDNFTVQSTILGVTTPIPLQISTHPNPITDSFEISAQNVINEISIFNIVGQKIETLHPDAKSVKLNIGNYQSGYYLINIVSMNQNTIVKIVKR